MKHTDTLALALTSALAAVFSSCEPQAFTMNMEMRYPSQSGIDLTGKSVAVVYLESGSGRDSVYNEYMSNSFASALEGDYFGGNEAVGLYRLTKDDGGNYASVDSLSRLVMETGDDIVFLFDAPEFGEVSVSGRSGAGGREFYSASVPVNVRLYAFDSMGKTDTVYCWHGSRTLSQSFPADTVSSRAAVYDLLWDAIDVQAGQVGRLSARLFSPTWKTESYTLLFYDTDAWNQAAQAASEYRWRDAMEIWMKLADTNSLMKRSCAEYNMATACYMLGDNELAIKWLNLSDEDYPISLSSGLRKRITARMR